MRIPVSMTVSVAALLAIAVPNAYAGTKEFNLDFYSAYNTPSYDGFSINVVETTTDVLDAGGAYDPVSESGTVTLNDVVYDTAFSSFASADQKIVPQAGGGYALTLGGASFDLLTVPGGAYADTTNVANCTGFEFDCNGATGYLATLESDNISDDIRGYAPILGGVTLAPGVPEPAAWAMMLIGFGAIGLARRGARRVMAP